MSSEQMDLERLTIGAVPACTGLNEPSVAGYFMARQAHVSLTTNRIIRPFEDLLRQQTGYDDDHIPASAESMDIKLGDLTFTVLSEPRIKRPSYAAVVDGLDTYMQFLQERHAHSVSQKGVRTFDGQPFINRTQLQAKLAELQEEVREREVKQTISHEYDEEFSGLLVIPHPGEIRLCEADALAYVRAEALQKYLTKHVVGPLERALKAQTGYDRNNVPTTMVTKPVQIGRHLFDVQTIPEQTVRYALVIKDFAKELENPLQDDSTPSGHSKATYQWRTDRGETYAALAGVSQRLDELKAQHTSPSVNQKLFHYPVVGLA